MSISRRGLLGAAAAALPITRAAAQAPKIRLGVLNDQSGPYRDVTGMTLVVCAQQAVQDFGAASRGLDVEVISADHQNKPDIGAGIAREWFDKAGVDAIVDVPTSSVALAVAQVARQKDKIMLNASATTTALTGEQCSPNTIVWSFDTYELSKSSGGAMVASGGKDWFFVTADYAFGHTLEEQTASLVTKAGGRVLGRARYPFPDTTDFSAFLTQAMASSTSVLGLANAGFDAVNCVKQAHEFGVQQSGMRIAPLLMFITDVHALGPAVAGGLTLTESFYWDLNDRTRAFTKRVLPKTPGLYPNQAHTSAYAITLHYLKAVAGMGTAEAKRSGAATVARMKAMPTDDDAFGPGSIRADGRGEFSAYLFQVKAPAESKEPWDLYKLVTTTPAKDALRPLDETHCALVRG